MPKSSIHTGKNMNSSFVVTGEACLLTITKTSMIFYFHRPRTMHPSSKLFKTVIANLVQVMTLPTVSLHSLQNERTIPAGVMTHFASPFRLVGEGVRLPSPASSAPNVDILSSLTPLPKPNSLMARISGPKLSITVPALPTTRTSASISTSGSHAPAPMAPNGPISASSAVPKAITPSPGLAVQAPTEFAVVASPPRLLYPSFSPFIHRRPSFIPSLHQLPNIFEKIVCSYNITAFASLLNKHNLTKSYPHLVYNLQHGFPLGRMPPLLSTVIIPNHPSVQLHMDSVTQYLEVEIAAGRMNGPFSPTEVEHILRGPFQASPFIVSIQTQAPGEPNKTRICRHLSKAYNHTPLVNSFIEKEDSPTRFDTAAWVAETVSILFLLHPSSRWHRTCTSSYLYSIH